MHEHSNVDRSARLGDLHTRLESGEFAAAFSMDSEPADGRLAAQRRDDFRLYGYAARVDHDPAEDFDAFLEDLWGMVASRFQLAPDDGAGDAPHAWWDDSDDGPALGCGDEADSPTTPVDVPAEERTRPDLHDHANDIE